MVNSIVQTRYQDPRSTGHRVIPSKVQASSPRTVLFGASNDEKKPFSDRFDSFMDKVFLRNWDRSEMGYVLSHERGKSRFLRWVDKHFPGDQNPIVEYYRAITSTFWSLFGSKALLVATIELNPDPEMREQERQELEIEFKDKPRPQLSRRDKFFLKFVFKVKESK